VAVKWYGGKVLKEIEADAEARLTVAAVRILKEAKRLMAEPKSGAMPPAKSAQQKKRGEATRKGFFTQRSAPGEAPAIQSGSAGLMASLAWSKPAKMVRRVGVSKEYGAWLELGTTKMKARPYLRPAMDSCRAYVGRLFTGGPGA